MIKLYKSIRFRTWLAFVVFAITMMAFVFVCLTYLTPFFYRYMKTQESTESMHMIIASWNTKSSLELKSLIDELATERQMDILVYNPHSELIYSKSASGSAKTIKARVDDYIHEGLKYIEPGLLYLPDSENGNEALLLVSYVGERENPQAYFFIYSYLEPMGTTMNIMTNMFFISSIVVLFIGVSMAVVLSSHVANPIVKISKNANKLITGNFYMPVKDREYEEIAVLIQNLNNASKEIEKTEALRKDLLANISHDLRTPLTMIKAYAEMIRDLSGNNPEKREKHVNVIIEESDRLTLLVSDVLNLSKIQSGVIELDRKPVNFSAHLDELINRFSLLNDTNDYSVELKTENDIYADFDIHKIEQVIYNLVNNAISYIGDDRLVRVNLVRINKQFARFEVSDHGIGIPEEQIPYIWERYYKVERSENHKRAVKGTGLGLAIVKGILEAHGFEYGCHSKVGQGSTFWFEFPVCEKDASEKNDV